MNVRPTELPGVMLIESRVVEDARGFFMETFHESRFEAAGLPTKFVQDNHSRSNRGTVRGLHYQIEHSQGKLIRVTRGEVFDVAVDLRRKSRTFGTSLGIVLSDVNRLQLYIPPGFAHGFCAISESADVAYKCTDFYYQEYERTLLWNDPRLNIVWPVLDPLLSEKDRHGTPLADVPTFDLTD
jgi:dTDP-4-dehydrorhamnose 3,5-epimerase